MSSSEAAAGMCAGYMFLMRGKKRSKYAKRFWTRRLFSPLGSLGEDPSSWRLQHFTLSPKLTFDIADIFLNFNIADFIFVPRKSIASPVY
jgi:hypothetical protein